MPSNACACGPAAHDGYPADQGALPVPQMCNAGKEYYINGNSFTGNAEVPENTNRWWCLNLPAHGKACTGGQVSPIFGGVRGVMCEATREGPTCGDGTQTDDEQCDDGNTTNNDGCSSTCHKENTCNTNNAKTYPANKTDWDASEFCTNGATANPSHPTFPSKGHTTRWTCTLNGIEKDCEAQRLIDTGNTGGAANSAQDDGDRGRMIEAQP